ncbi:FHA domain-containing protein [Altericista sp. CCNU0014]|uniref:FHA domain-containing protein n=1 Tax=Altericista sp. CCNU0014 TaxID=3082949 RepID=UPI00384A8CB8
MTSSSVPQLFLPSDSPYATTGTIERGFWSPMNWMTRFSSSLPAGYYYSLVGQKFWTVGSSPNCKIVCTDDQISSQHALLIATANREIYFCDLQSINGSFVNQRPISCPVLLHHGDRLKMGPLELEFQYSGELPVARLPAAQKTVLLVQVRANQDEIWRTLLKTCGVSIHEDSYTDRTHSEAIETLLERLERKPDLIVADLEALKPNPYEFCRWCRGQHPSLKIILTCGNRADIFSSERRWVKQQGAIDLLPGFSQESFFSLSLTDAIARFECVLQALDLPASQVSSLEPMLRSLMYQLNAAADPLP